MSAGSGPSCGLLSGSDPVEAIEQENGVPASKPIQHVLFIGGNYSGWSLFGKSLLPESRSWPVPAGRISPRRPP
jgi:hypothetical protein